MVPPQRPGGSGWPTGGGQQPEPAFFVLLGAQFMPFPSWVSCFGDDGVCLLGYEEEVLVTSRRADVLAEVPMGVDPQQSLIDLGLTQAHVGELLTER